METVKKVSKVISWIFSPLIVPFYCLAVLFFITPLKHLPVGTRMSAITAIFCLTFVLPCVGIWLLYVCRLIKDLALNGRNERLIPYIMSIVWYCMTLFYLWFVHAPDWMLHFILGGIIAVVINTLVNLRWKISGHLASMGCATGLMVYIYATLLAPHADIWLYAVILLAGLTGSARGILEKHSLGQIGAGYINGLISTSLVMFLL